MEKKARISLKNNEEVIQYDILINIVNKKINYTEKDINNTNVFLDLNEKILIRDNNEIYMEYNFKTNKGIVYIKNLQNTINIDLVTKKYIVNDKKIEIEYELEKDNYYYLIDMEV